MKHPWLAVCLALGLLVGCTPADSSEPVPSATPFDASALPAEAQPEAKPVQNEDGLWRALDQLTVYGEGEAGVSLKTAIATAALLDWAEDNAVSSPIDSISQSIVGWLASKTADQQTQFWVNWSTVDDSAQAIARDITPYLSVLDSAGNPHQHEKYTPAKYERLHCSVEGALEDA